MTAFPSYCGRHAAPPTVDFPPFDLIDLCLVFFFGRIFISMEIPAREQPLRLLARMAGGWVQVASSRPPLRHDLQLAIR